MSNDTSADVSRLIASAFSELSTKVTGLNFIDPTFAKFWHGGNQYAIEFTPYGAGQIEVMVDLDKNDDYRSMEFTLTHTPAQIVEAVMEAVGKLAFDLDYQIENAEPRTPSPILPTVRHAW